MTNKELFYFAGKCLSMEEHPGFSEEIILKIEQGSVNWEKFIRLCSNHLILPLIFLKFKTNGILSHLPRELADFLKDVYQLNLSRNNQILEQLDDIAQLLNKQGIYPTLLKGAGNIVDNMYGDIGERMMGDVDFLVAEKDYLPTAKLMESDGYFSKGEHYLDPKEFKHYPRLSKKGAPADVEIHRLPVSDDYIRWFNTEIIDARKKSIGERESFYVVSDRHKIVMNFIHSQLIDKAHAFGVVSLRDIYDLYMYSRRTDIAEAIPMIKPKSIAIDYFVFAGKALGLDKRFYQNETISSRLFCLKHDLNLTSKVFYYSHRSVRFLLMRLFVGYLGQLAKSVYSKGMRRSILKRLGNPRWYWEHIKSYTNFLFRNTPKGF